MKNKNKIDIFLKYIIKIYQENPLLSVSEDTIWSELRLFSIKDNEYSKIKRTNLVPVQFALGKEYPDNSWSNKYFWIFENRKEDQDKEFISKINKGIKLYVAVDEPQLYLLAHKIYNFILKANIEVQSKIAKKMQNDVFVIRVTNKEDALKIINYINKLKYLDEEKKALYNPKIYPNPFIYNEEKVSVVVDTYPAYSDILTNLLNEYIEEKKESNKLDNVCSEDFKNFLLSKHEENSNCIINQFIKNIDDELTLDTVFSFQSKEDYSCFEENAEESAEEDRQLVIKIMKKMEEKYDLKEMHMRLLHYFKYNDVSVFTKDHGIRKTITQKFSSKKLKEVVSNIGFHAFLEASSETIKKYHDISQLEYAIKILLKEEEGKEPLEGFTNNKDVRSRLGFLIPESLLLEELERKVKEKGKALSSKSVLELVNEHLEKNKEKKNK